MAKNLEPIEPVDPKKFLPTEQQELNTDLSYVRQNQYDLIETAQKALEGILAVAEASQHPRAYEVLATLLKTTSELNMNLVQTSEKKAQVREEGSDVKDGQIINNNVFVGTPADLLALINGKKKSAKDTDERPD